MRQSEIIKYYSRPEIAKEITRLASSRETITRLGGGGFSRRPDIIEMPGDVVKLARMGASSFHTSEEIWHNPLDLSAESTALEMDTLRSGWDLVIDIDSPNVKYGKIVARLILQMFEYHGLKNASLKFSGNKGFHLGVPFKAMPKSIGVTPANPGGEPIEKTFPDAPRVIAEYISEFIRPHLSEAILNRIGDIAQIVKDTGKSKAELFVTNKQGEKEFDPYKIIELDTILIAPRHLFRMPYSLHEKSWLASIVLAPEELEKFDRDVDAKPNNVDAVRDWFLNPDRVEAGEATQLVVQAFDWKKRETKVAEADTVRRIEFEGEIDESMFPPCIKHVLQGLEDGRKRALFALANFFKCLNWSYDKFKFQLEEWNKKNKPPLKVGYLRSQLAWHRVHGQKVPPPNCDNAAYYKDLGVCRPDSMCEGIKNPLSYVSRRVRMSSKGRKRRKK